MMLIVVYLALMLAGDVVAYGIGYIVERPHLVGLPFEPQKTVSLAIFLAAYFVNLWLAWQLAVKLTAPKDKVQPA
jgi:CDP-diglyceride synthetase